MTLRTGGSWRISGWADQAQVSKSRLHRVVAAQDLFQFLDGVHLSCTGHRHLFLLLQRGPGRLAAGQGGLLRVIKQPGRILVWGQYSGQGGLDEERHPAEKDS